MMFAGFPSFFGLRFLDGLAKTFRVTRGCAQRFTQFPRAQEDPKTVLHHTVDKESCMTLSDQDPRNYGSIVHMGSCRIYMFNR